ncbi:MAG: hypothetical protein ABIN18_20135 [Pseudomonadota bacterium]
MKTVLVSIIIVIILYKLFSSRISIFILERKISKIRPSVITYLNNEKEKWEETLKKFDSDDKIVRDFYTDNTEILEAIGKIKKDLDVDNKYQMLKNKFRENPRSQRGLAHNYVKFLECIDYFQRTSGVDISVLSEAEAKNHIEFNAKVGEKKLYIYKIFDELLST